MKEKVLLFDIEIVAVPSDRLTEYLYTKQYKEIQKIMMGAEIAQVVCIGYKWLGEKHVHCIDIQTSPAKKGQQVDYEVLKQFSVIAQQADIIVGHYSSGFDIKFVQSRLLINSLPILPPYKHFDTCMIAMHKLHLGSNKLDDIAITLGCKSRKIDKGGWKWWLALAKGDDSVIPKMARYCRMDVQVLEEIYLKLRPLIVNYPEFRNRGVCLHCKSTHLQKRGLIILKTKTKERLQCQNCGAWGSREVPSEKE